MSASIVGRLHSSLERVAELEKSTLLINKSIENVEKVMRSVGKEKVRGGATATGGENVSNDTVLELVETVKILRVAMEMLKKSDEEDDHGRE